jgi:hypothetical protein
LAADRIFIALQHEPSFKQKVIQKTFKIRKMKKNKPKIMVKELSNQSFVGLTH